MPAYFWLPFYPCGRRGWGMRDKDLSVNQALEARRENTQPIANEARRDSANS